MPTALLLALLALPVQEPQLQTAPLATWVDVDLDGRLDLFLTDGTGDRLLVGMDAGAFVERAAAAGLDTERGSRLALWADYDGDGWPDLYRVRASGVGELLRNMADGTFAPVGQFAGIPDARGVLEARWLDVEGDGHPDLALWTGTGLVLARGLGDGTFETGAIGQPGGASLLPAGNPDTAGAQAHPGEVLEDPEGGGSIALVPTSITPAGAGSRNVMSAAPNCPLALDDTAVIGSCLQASTVPTLGMLYPLSAALFVTPGGNVGIGTTTPADRLDVAGTLEADGLRIPTGAGQGMILTSDGAGNGTWKPVPVTGINGGGTTYTIPRFIAPGTLGDSIIQTTIGGQIGIGLSTPLATLGLAADLSDRALRLTGSGTNGSGAKLIFGANDNDTYISDFQEDSLYLVAPKGVGVGPGNLGVHVPDLIIATHSVTVGPKDPTDHNVLRVFGPLGAVGYGARFNFGDLRYVELEEDTDDHLRVYAARGTSIEKDPNTPAPTLLLEQAVGGGTGSPALRVRNTSAAAGIALFSEAYGFDANAVFTHYGTGSLIKGFVNGALKFEVKNDGKLVCNELEITGGADLAEPFETAAPVAPGTVLVIDHEHPGELRTSSEAYDTRVAGVVSGAGGIRPGLSLRQEGATAGETPVALTGRAYVRCSAENGPVRAGDLLTTAATPGHAMRASDSGRAFGAVLGKAMSPLDEGTGLVLVLVNLQ